jgi:hypothetical protein
MKYTESQIKIALGIMSGRINPMLLHDLLGPEMSEHADALKEFDGNPATDWPIDPKTGVRFMDENQRRLKAEKILCDMIASTGRHYGKPL